MSTSLRVEIDVGGLRRKKGAGIGGDRADGDVGLKARGLRTESLGIVGCCLMLKDMDNLRLSCAIGRGWSCDLPSSHRGVAHGFVPAC